MTRAQQKSAALAVLVALLLAVLWWSEAGEDGTRDTGTDRPTTSSASSPDGLGTVDVADLPEQARETIALIESDGPFPHDEDGSTFQNREGLLPQEPRGYYREYTVPTPGADDRGARRIVTGGDTMYWTADHYRSFARIIGVD